ncbi:uncharacterized protein LOC110449331 [Mizuhopecten yessoensis]|uniref:uncharacterized protein LOC110449331 n=1 Tax=Mizuhopecten yessoensis TaxID=6573 RepID=UPI000B45802B|nr:uncharacterized protein LOC110449331 [Mizuhopecten yessoensis]
MRLVPNFPDLVPAGVWFCATLYNGGLPQFSPYGDRRVKIPFAGVIQQLGGNVKLFKDVIDRHSNGNTYVKLMLVKGNDNIELFKHMTELDTANNPWLKLYGGNGVAKTPIWVEIYVPYPIDVSNCIWEEVQRI